MKRRRYEDVHRASLRWPSTAFTYVGIDNENTLGEDYAGEVRLIVIAPSTTLTRDDSEWEDWNRLYETATDVKEFSRRSVGSGILFAGCIRIIRRLQSCGRCSSIVQRGMRCLMGRCRGVHRFGCILDGRFASHRRFAS